MQMYVQKLPSHRHIADDDKFHSWDTYEWQVMLKYITITFWKWSWNALYISATVDTRRFPCG